MKTIYLEDLSSVTETCKKKKNTGGKNKIKVENYGNIYGRNMENYGRKYTNILLIVDIRE